MPFKHSLETKLKIAESLRGKPHHTEERKVFMQTLKDEKSLNWKEGHSKKYCYRLAFEKLPNKCNMCNSTENLLVHHKNNDTWDNSNLENLEILCRKCHAKIHLKGKKRPEQSQLMKERYEKGKNPLRNYNRLRRIIFKKLSERRVEDTPFIETSEIIPHHPTNSFILLNRPDKVSF